MKNNEERMGHYMNPERNNPAVYEYTILGLEILVIVIKIVLEQTYNFQWKKLFILVVDRGKICMEKILRGIWEDVDNMLYFK